MAEVGVTKERLVEDLRKLGLRAGDVAIVHSALSSLGRVEGGAKTVIEALLEVLTPSGTLVMPTFGSSAPFDVDDTPSTLGVITETFRKYPGVVRSLHPTHSVAARGARAEALIEDHVKSPSACGRETPFGRIIEMGGKILLLGVDNDRNTVMHTLEEYVKAPYLSDREARYLDAEGRERTVQLELFPGPHRDFIGLHPLFRKRGVEVVGRAGNAVARLIDARKMHDVMLEAFKDDPALVLCDNPSCADCVMQRREIRLARLKAEEFTLSALASSVSPYPEEIAAEMNRAGIYDVVVDRLYGGPVWRLGGRRLRRAGAVFEEEGIRVGALYLSPDPAALEKGLERAEILKPDELVAPFPPTPGAFVDAAGKRGLRALFENTTLTSGGCSKLLESAGEGQGIAFNPAAFAMMGEKPFIRAFSHSRLRHRVGILFVNDATSGGEYTLPGRGNAEVKELVSILRCRSFSGRMVISTGPGGPGFRDLVEGFWRLLETM